MLQFRNVSKSYLYNNQFVPAINNISFHVNPKEIVGIIGPSGAGKSTLLRCANLLERPDSGEILFHNENLLTLSINDLRVARRKMSMIFQHFNLLSNYTVFDNIALPLRLIHEPEDQIKKRVHTLLDIVNINHREKAYPSQLSGGEKQRVAIARALITNPELLLCDEATSALDPETTFAILKLLQKINRELNLSLLLITHEMSVIKEITDRVIVLENGDIVEANQTIHVFEQPQSEIAKKFVHSLINKPLPLSVAAQLSDADMLRGKVIRLVFKHHASTETMLSEMIRDLNIKVSILQANIEAVGSDTIGTVLIRLMNTQDEKEAVAYLQARQVSVEEVSHA